MDVVTKSVEAAVAPVESDFPGEFEVILSTETKDRDDENLWAEEWKQPLPARIHIDGDHGRTLEKTVGSAVPTLENGRLIGKGTYAKTDYAQMVRQLVNDGHINSVSVTYAERKNAKGEGTVERELLNAAFVAIPANPEAVVLASKSATPDLTPLLEYDLREYFKGDKAKVKYMMDFIKKTAVRTAFGFADHSNHLDLADKAEGGVDASGNNPQVKHDDMVQAIHDAAIHLGAQCMNDIEADSGASDGANKSYQVFRSDDGTISYRAIGSDQVRTLSLPEIQKMLERADLTKSSSPEAGAPQESTEEPTAETADKAAEAAEESADDAAQLKAKELEIGRGLIAYFKSKNLSKD